MINLAGVEGCDKDIRDELTRAGISIVTEKSERSEVPYTVIGKLGQYTFRRAWYYWVVTGDVPMDIAKKIYAHPEGKACVRVAGHCGCVAPEKWSDYPESSDGLDPISQKQIDQYEKESPTLWNEYKHKYRLATVEEENNKVVNNYHIDSQAGLLLFALMVQGAV